jgi:hypothetical protein
MRVSNIKVPCGCEGLTCFDTGIDPEEVIDIGVINRFSYQVTSVHVNSEATPYRNSQPTASKSIHTSRHVDILISFR